jgi:phospholipase/carboxylesterase
MNRFFKREGFALPDGRQAKYDEQSIKDEAKKLSEFIKIYSKYRDIKLENIRFVGFSNGANMILASQLIYPDLFFKTVLLHPANVLKVEKQDLKHQEVLLTYGSQDQMITIDESLEVLDLLKENSANVEEFDNEAGHNISIDEVEKLNEFVV